MTNKIKLTDFDSADTATDHLIVLGAFENIISAIKVLREEYIRFKEAQHAGKATEPKPSPKTRLRALKNETDRPASDAGRANHAEAVPDREIKLSSGERDVLISIAQHNDFINTDRVSVLTMLKRSTRDLYLQRLRRVGFITGGSNTLEATDAAYDWLGPDYEPLATGEALRNAWLEYLPSGEAKLLAILITGSVLHWQTRGMGIMLRDTLSEGTGLKRSTRDLYLQNLKRRKLITTHPGGGVAASIDLFRE